MVAHIVCSREPQPDVPSIYGRASKFLYIQNGIIQKKDILAQYVSAGVQDYQLYLLLGRHIAVLLVLVYMCSNKKQCSVQTNYQSYHHLAAK
jgi:hypothetical protein